MISFSAMPVATSRTVSATPSISVFQALQCGHLPCHLGVLPPHSVHV